MGSKRGQVVERFTTGIAFVLAFGITSFVCLFNMACQVCFSEKCSVAMRACMFLFPFVCTLMAFQCIRSGKLSTTSTTLKTAFLGWRTLVTLQSYQNKTRSKTRLKLEFNLATSTLTSLVRLAPATVCVASRAIIGRASISASNSGQGLKSSSEIVYKNKIQLLLNNKIEMQQSNTICPI